METEEISVRLSNRLVDRVDEACGVAGYVDRSELVSLALAWTAQEGTDVGTGSGHGRRLR